MVSGADGPCGRPPGLGSASPWVHSGLGVLCRDGLWESILRTFNAVGTLGPAQAFLGQCSREIRYGVPTTGRGFIPPVPTLSSFRGVVLDLLLVGVANADAEM